MKPILELVVKGEDPEKVAVFACGECRRACYNQQHAEECCTPHPCEGGCGVMIPRGSWLTCDECRLAKDDAKQTKALSAARRIPVADYAHDIVCLEYHPDESDYVPTEDVGEDYSWAWACIPLPWPVPDMVDAVESLLEGEFPEDARFPKGQELQTVVNEWCVENLGPSGYYTIDKTSIVIFDEDPSELVE